MKSSKESRIFIGDGGFENEVRYLGKSKEFLNRQFWTPDSTTIGPLLT